MFQFIQDGLQRMIIYKDYVQRFQNKEVYQQYLDPKLIHYPFWILTLAFILAYTDYVCYYHKIPKDLENSIGISTALWFIHDMTGQNQHRPSGCSNFLLAYIKW